MAGKLVFDRRRFGPEPLLEPDPKQGADKGAEKESDDDKDKLKLSGEHEMLRIQEQGGRQALSFG